MRSTNTEQLQFSFVNKRILDWLIVPETTYYESSGTLYSTQSLAYSGLKKAI